MVLISDTYNLYIYAPESVEWLILKGMWGSLNEVEGVVDLCDITKYLTWERYFTDVLSRKCIEEFGKHYSKGKLLEELKISRVLAGVKSQIKDIADI